MSNDAHAKPPQAIRDVYKRLQKMKHFEEKPLEISRESAVGSPSPRDVFGEFTGLNLEAPSHLPQPETCDIPGLLIYRAILPPEVQLLLLDTVFHRDLGNPEHLTNVHLHYDVPYPRPEESYFDRRPAALRFEPQNPSVHKPFETCQYLSKKLRWMTLGAQYDWTSKVYPSGPPPSFPADMKKLISDLFGMRPEAAIVNLYSPGDTLSLHRDVSEECNRPLVSISLGCDGIFLVGLEGETDAGQPRLAALRLRSGDAVVMTGESRYAWHGVPKVIGDTCPNWMQDWPCADEQSERFALWKGWMRTKRINLNVRQMFA